MKVLPFLFVLVLTGCASLPPNLTPQAQIAWKSYEIQKDLDLLRDVAVDANAQTPPLLTTDVTAKIVTFHRAAIITIHNGRPGWRASVISDLDDLQRLIPPAQYAVIARYVALARAVLEVTT